MNKIILTGDRPTGKLHLGHYVGSLKNRLRLQETDFDKMYIMIADAQALTDNFDNPQKIRSSIMEIMLDYLSIGLDPSKCTFFIQSEVPALYELSFFYLNVVTLARLKRNPTVKTEITLREFNERIPMGFLTYPVSQTADITAFNATLVPVGEDQLPMIEQAKDIVRSFNYIYGDVLVSPEALIPDGKIARRLPGIDGKQKMSKSLNNAIFLSDSEEELKKKVFSMYTDPNHIAVNDPGNVENNTVFTYLDIFASEDSFKKYLPEYENLDALKSHYERGGLGDVKIKKFLFEILNELLSPIRERRKYYEEHLDEVTQILKRGTEEAQLDADKTLQKVRKAMKINYFEDDIIKSSYEAKNENNR